MTDSPDERGAELRELFFETSQELLQALNEESLKLEKRPGDEEIVRSIRRTVHTLKGDSAACGLRELSELAHQFEDALSLETAAAHSALAEIAFAAADVFTAMIAAYHGGGPMPATTALRKRIDELTSAPAAKKSRRKKKSTAPGLHSGKDWTESEKRAMAQAQASGVALYDVVVKIDPHCPMPIAARQLIQNALGGVGQVLVVRPDAKSPAASKQVEFVLASSHSEEQIGVKARIPTIAADASVILLAAGTAKVSAKAADTMAPTAQAWTPAIEVSPHHADAYQTEVNQADVNSVPGSHAPAATLQVQPASLEARTPAEVPALATTENILRVEAGRINSVLNLVGELIIGKSMLQQALNEFGKR